MDTMSYFAVDQTLHTNMERGGPVYSELANSLTRFVVFVSDGTSTMLALP